MTKKKKKKRSPSNSGSPGRNSSGREGNHSVSRMSAAGLHAHSKLKPTLDQGLHFVQASVKVPAKQTAFYDQHHASHITEQQMQQWRVKNGEVTLDAFHKGKKAVPVNRHRIPNVGVSQHMHDHGCGPPQARKRSPVDADAYVWDMDGRRHKRTSKKNPVVITSNASLHKVDLPTIKPSNLSPHGPGNKSQPPGRMPQAVSTGKFVDPHLPGRRLRNPPTHLNVQSDAGLSLIDIDLKPNRDPEAKIHEPPIHDDPPVRDEPPTAPKPATPKKPESPQPASFKPVSPPESPGVPVERHIRMELCRFCRKPFKMTELLDHEAQCPDAVHCPFCGIELSAMDYDFHLVRCPEVTMCRFCGNKYASKDIEPHEQVCPDRAECRFCGLLMPKSQLEPHILRVCPKAKPGVAGDADVDPRPYQEMLEKNAEKLKRKSTAKVIVEDNFIQPTDFRDPANRKKTDS